MRAPLVVLLLAACSDPPPPPAPTEPPAITAPASKAAPAEAEKLPCRSVALGPECDRCLNNAFGPCMTGACAPAGSAWETCADKNRCRTKDGERYSTDEACLNKSCAPQTAAVRECLKKCQAERCGESPAGHDEHDGHDH